MQTDAPPKGIASCHPQRKLQARGLCKPCYDKWLKENNPGYKERQKGINAEWRARNPDKCREYTERRQQRIRSDPVERKRVRRQSLASSLRIRFGITLDDYDQLLESQHGRCAICQRAPTERGLHLDHCHKTNKVRGFLCHQCNWYLGTIENDPENLNRLINYLHKHQLFYLTIMTNKTQALRNNKGKVQLSMVPPSLSENVARVLMFGATVYERDNWRKGFPWTSVCDSLERHLNAWKRGEDLDPDSRLPHLAHIACNVAFLIEFYETSNGFDDRFKEIPIEI